MNLRKTVCCPTLVLCGVLTAASTSLAAEIQWSGNLYQSYLQAVKENKPLIVLFTCDCEEGCWGRRLEQEVLRTGSLDGFADQGVFVKAGREDEDDQGNYAKLKEDLKIERLPTLVMLDVQSDGIRECGRVIGYFESQEYVAQFKQLRETWEARHPEVITRVGAVDFFIPYGWSNYVSRGLGFQAAFAKSPNVFQASPSGGSFAVYTTAPGGGPNFMVFVREAPTAVIEEIGAGAWLKLDAKACAEEQHGEASEVTLPEGTNPAGCQFRIVDDEGTEIAQARTVLHGTRLYTLVAKTVGGTSDTVIGKLFLRSFRPIDKAEKASIVPTPAP